MTYKISIEAQIDIENIWLHTFETWLLEQADRYVNLIFDEIEYLTRNPTSGKDIEHIREGYCQSKVKAHFVFYRIHLEENELEIIRVLNQKMNIESRLND